MRYLAILLLFPCFAYGQDIVDVSGTVQDGLSIRITGTLFGSGPTVRLFEDFEAGTDGAVCAPTNATLGQWDSWNDQYPATYIEESGGNTCATMVDEDVWRQGRITFDPVSEIFISMMAKVPEGKHFPNSFAENLIKSGVNAIKIAWLLDGDGAESSSSANDIVVPNCNAAAWYFHSNVPGILGSSYNMGTTGQPSQWWSFTNTRWNRMSSYFKAPATGESPTGIAYFSGMSEQYGMHETTFSNVVLSHYDNPTWDRLYFAAWTKTGDPLTQMYYDNIYIATGANARARIEIGNKQVYGECTRMVICTPTTWSPTSIDATVRNQVFANDEQAYVFVIGADGVASGGHLVTIVGSGTMGQPTDATIRSGG